jgi:short-subunit dehydrogenase
MVSSRARTILITGASSGIGAALAEASAAPGRLLVLCGRDPLRLAAVAAGCQGRGATAVTWPVDIRDVGPFLEQLSRFDEQYGFDAVLFSAGVGDTRDNGAIIETPEAVVSVTDVNFRAPAAAAAFIGARMAARGGGAIGIVSSIAALVPLPMAVAYTGSKAGLTAFGRALDGALRPHGVSVTVVCPAFVDTPMSQRLTCWKPFLCTPGAAADRILRAVRRRRRLVVFPFPYAVLARTLDWLPKSVVAVLFSRVRFESRPYQS